MYCPGLEGSSWRRGQWQWWTCDWVVRGCHWVQWVGDMASKVGAVAICFMPRKWELWGWEQRQHSGCKGCHCSDWFKMKWQKGNEERKWLHVYAFVGATGWQPSGMLWTKEMATVAVPDSQSCHILLQCHTLCTNRFGVAVNVLGRGRWELVHMSTRDGKDWGKDIQCISDCMSPLQGCRASMSSSCHLGMCCHTSKPKREMLHIPFHCSVVLGPWR